MDILLQFTKQSNFILVKVNRILNGFTFFSITLVHIVWKQQILELGKVFLISQSC